MAHKFFGLSVADLAIEGQKIETSLLRAVLDNAYLQINGRYFAVEGQVNLDDLLISRPGGVVRMKQQGMAGRLDQGSGDSQLGMGMLEYMKGFNEDSTGWSRNSAGTNGDALKSPITATESNIVTNRADMRVDLIARNFAEGYRDLFRLMLKLVSQYQADEAVVKLRGEWVPIKPREWRDGFDMSINVGLGTGNRDQQVGHLMMMRREQDIGLQMGTVNPQNVYAAQKEIVRALGYKTPDKFFSDPSKAPPHQQPPMPEMVKAQSAMQLKQMDLEHDAKKFTADLQLKMQANEQAHQARIAEIQKQYELQASNDQRDAQREQAKAMYDREIAAAEQENKRQLAVMDAEIQKYKADLDAQVKLTIAQQSAAPAIDLSPVQASLDALAQHLAAPVEIVRGPDGKALGVKRGDTVRQVKRGPDGRAMGLQ
jgi:hypothetical protein